MRRSIAGVLVFVLFSQLPGAALAGAPDDVNPADSIRTLIDPIVAAIVSSRAYAVVTGAEDRYAALHAPAPEIARPTDHLDALALMHRERPLRPQLRHGTPHAFAMPPRSELSREHHRLDPLAMRKSVVPGSVETQPSPDMFEPLHTLAVLQGAHLRSPFGQVRPRGTGIKRLATSAPTTGIEHWWTYEEHAIPGIGKAMVNVGTGNYLVAAMDVDVPERGIDLAFQRVYNSQSLHDANGDDGGEPAIFGNYWTNTFDANIVYNSSERTITVYDLNGTACTYTADGSGNWVPCTGEYATLTPTDSNDCTYAWQKKDGTVYWFHTDVSGSGCSIQQAKLGHIQQILGRNQTNTITFTYSYDGSGYSSEDVTEIDAEHSDGQELVMKFGLIPDTSINELGEIDRPDNAKLQYSYDKSGNLLEVDKPGNNSAINVPSGNGVPTGDAPETYAYGSGSSVLEEACGPRCTVAMWNHPNDPGEGAAILFTADSSNRLTSWEVSGVLNFTPYDGTTQTLQPGLPTSFQSWYVGSFVYGSGSACSASGSGTTTMCDTDGHATIWTPDSRNRVTQTQEFAGNNVSIITQEVWGSDNNLNQAIDANGNITKYAYDSNGNLVEMQQPNVSDIGGGSLNPLSYYSYDQYNNVTAYCDPVFNQAQGNGWVSSPGDSLCPSASGAARFTFNLQDTDEPYGCLATMKKPGGYATTISYPSSPGPCGKGLPIETQGAVISQYDDSTRQPTQDFGYDGYGNLTSYDKGVGSGGHYQDSWTLSYDPENRLMERTENDSTIPLTGSSFTCYYADGSVFYTETPSQHNADGDPNCPSPATMLGGNVTPPQHATAYYYDVDGNQTEMTTHKGCSTSNPCPGPVQMTVCNSTESSNPIGTTCKYYDGLDRLVETTEPYDPRSFSKTAPYEFYAFRWMDRYIYDLSQAGGSADLQISDSTGTIGHIVAFGNLYKTQEYLPQPQGMLGLLSHGQYSGADAQWNDVRGTSFDKVDRAVNKYELAYGTTAVTANSYDCTGQIALLCSTTNAVGQTTAYTYDNINRLRQVTFSGTAPQADNRSYTFDADGRTTSAANSMGTLSYAYDSDGNKTSVTEPANQPAASLICYTYYPDGMREFLGIGIPGEDQCPSIKQRSNPSNGGISQPQLFRYSYRTDGLPATEQVNWNGNQMSNAQCGNVNQQTPTFCWVFSPSGRETSETDPLTGTTVTTAYYNTKTKLAPESFQYDGYGRTSSLTLPMGFQETPFFYDTDDETVGYSYGGSGSGSNPTRQLTLNARGEIIQDGADIFVAQGQTYMANGTQVGNGDFLFQGYPYQVAPSIVQYDMRSGMVTASPDVDWATHSLNGGADVFTYDGAGRKAKDDYWPQWPSGSVTLKSTLQHDAENHLVSSGSSASGSGYTVYGTAQYGADGRDRIETYPATNSPYSYTSFNYAHWDGDSILFASTATPGTKPGAPVLYIGKLAVMDAKGELTILDRDTSGAEVSSHAINSLGDAWFNGVTMGTVTTLQYYNPKTGQTVYISIDAGSCGFYAGQQDQYYPCPSSNATTNIFPMNRLDGYTMFGGIVQGARTFSPATGQWTTPDAYAGDVNDPMSQKPFIWNNNNGEAYLDPNGYDAVFQSPDGGGAQSLFTDWSLIGTAGGDLAQFGQAVTQTSMFSGAVSVLAQNSDAQSSDAPSGLVVQPSPTRESNGYIDDYVYQVINSDGQPVTGSGYQSMEDVWPAKGNITSNGLWVPAVSGNRIVDQVGPADPPTPDETSSSITFQSFWISYQGTVYTLPDSLMHIVNVVNGAVTTSVYDVVPDPVPWE